MWKTKQFAGCHGHRNRLKYWGMAAHIPSDDILIGAWHSDDPTAALAEELGIGSTELNRQWLRLKAQGRLPDIPRTVKGVALSGKPEGDHDGRPSVDSLYHEDALLEKLWTEFPDGPREDLYPGVKVRK
jgi:hypothetical protein